MSGIKVLSESTNDLKIVFMREGKQETYLDCAFYSENVLIRDSSDLVFSVPNEQFENFLKKANLLLNGKKKYP